jgi:hemerythrin-like metal-binding protein
MGAYFQWDQEKFSVLVDAMDHEHQNLIAIMNELHERHGAGAGTAELASIVKRLGDYTAHHFADEERYLESIRFPGIVSHKAIHKELLTRFGEHVAIFQKSGKLEAEFFAFLSAWLKMHIRGLDRKYGEFATGKKAA